jgi:hypothetical protein
MIPRFTRAFLPAFPAAGTKKLERKIGKTFFYDVE